MLDSFKDSQNFAYTLFKNQIKLNEISHAYLIDDNNSNDGLNITLSFVKEMLCKNKDICNNCDQCNICSLIDKGNYPELKVIKSDGMYIKKGQLLDLQEDFSKSSVYGNKKIYIIIDADKMHSESSNTILKFLEEPSSDIVAFLITNNFNNMLSTIVSRCQIVRLNNNNSIEKDTKYNDICFNFLSSIENDMYNAFLSEKKLFFDVIEYKNRENVILFIDTLIDMYYDILKIFTGSKLISFTNFYDSFSEISKINRLDELIYKLQYLIESKDFVKFNVNINLLVDNIIFNVGGHNEYSRS